MNNGNILTQTGEANTDLFPFPGQKAETKGQLRILSDNEKSAIIVSENPYSHPFSWFLTHASGKMSKSGRIAFENQIITLEGLESGIYHFRAQGEIHEINVA